MKNLIIKDRDKVMRGGKREGAGRPPGSATSKSAPWQAGPEHPLFPSQQRRDYLRIHVTVFVSLTIDLVKSH